LPLQGLDYWLGDKWLEDRGQFRECGYFPGLTPLAGALPGVSGFPFSLHHRACLALFSVLDSRGEGRHQPEVARGLKVLFRRVLQQGRVLDEGRD
jgi:hypothetical protein